MKKILAILTLMAMTLCAYAQSVEDQQKKQQTEASIAIFKQAQEAYETGNDNAAKRLFQQIVNMPAAPLELRDRAAAIIAIIDERTVTVQTTSGPEVHYTEKMTNISADGDFREITVSSRSNWQITSLPSWCSIEEQSRKYIKIWCSENPTKGYRSGIIVITASGIDKLINIEQKPGVEKKGRVYFKTNPHNTYISSSDGSTNYSSSPLVFGKGEYNITVSKDGYKSKDTLIVINEVADTTRIIEVELEPVFGKLEPLARSESGDIINDIEVTIGVHKIDMKDLANSHSFDDRADIRYYSLYKEGVIPLSPGDYDVTISAEGHRPVTRNVHIDVGETTRLEVPMEFIMSKIVVRNEKNAEGAEVRIPQLGIIGTVGDTLTVPVGRYDIEVKKEGYLLDVGILTAEVKREGIQVLEASMIRTVPMYISTVEGGERVKINGEQMNYQKPYHQFSLIDGETYDVDITKPGYWHIVKHIEVTPKDTLFDFRNLQFTKIDTLVIDSDLPNLEIKLYRHGDPEKLDYAEGARTPEAGEKTELLIPYGKYKIILEDDDEIKRARKTAYRGTFKFTEKTKGKYFNSWMKSGLETMRFLTVEGTLKPSYDSSSPDFMSMPLKASVGEFAITRGLSTVLLTKAAMIYTEGMNFPDNLPDNYYTKLLPALSLPLTSWDFRIGGGFCQYGDISLMLSYSYYIDLDNIAQGFSDKFIKKEENKYAGNLGDFFYFSGHDVFAGLEVGSRIKCFNIYARAGVQYLKGNRYYSYYSGNTNTIDAPTYTDIRFPVNQTTFIIAVGFNIGSGRAKGQNILRIF